MYLYLTKTEDYIVPYIVDLTPPTPPGQTNYMKNIVIAIAPIACTVLEN